MSEPDSKSDFFTNKTRHVFFNPFLFLGLIVSFSFLLRMYYFPPNVPLGLDALGYFSYAAELSQYGQFPQDQKMPNNGWPTFLSIFFHFLHSQNFLDYMELQRYVSIAISLSTIIPVYLLCRRFFAVQYSLLGATLFAFEPKIITNSLLGITESLYLFLGVITLFLFLGKSYKLVYVAFATSALFALVRYEGLLLIIPLSIMFFVRFRKERRLLFRYFAAIAIFVLTLLPMVYIRVETTGQDGLTSHLFEGPNYVSEIVIKGTPDDDYPITATDDQSRIIQYVFRGITSLGKYLAWFTIPSFFMFVGLGSYMIIRDHKYRNLDYRVITILLFTVVLLLPAFYAYMRGIQEIRYVFTVLPVFCLISLFTIKKFNDRFGRFSLIMILVVAGIFFSSLPFLEAEKIDYEHERESFFISQHIVKTPKVINADPLDGNYITTAQVVKKWPVISSPDEFDVARISTTGFNSLEEFIENSIDKGLTHVVADGKKNRASFLADVFYHEERYPYLIKEYDSAEYNLKYHVKMYRIDYELFHENQTAIKMN